MLPVSTLLSLLVIIYSRRTSAQLQPTTPGPDETYTAGLNCTIAWEPDSSGSWTNVTIDLMSGSNNNMSLVTNVITGLDGTDTSLTPFSWTCPEVNPFSTIYFYQFTNGEDTSTRAWTTRFTITSPANETEPPENPEQPDGENVPWGIGYIKSPSKSASTSNSSTNSTNSLDSSTSDSETEGSAGSSNAKKPHGHKSDSDSANSDSPSDTDDVDDGKRDEKGERKNNADVDETDDSSEEKSSTKTHPANVSGAKSSAARATSVAHSGTHDSFSSSPNDSDTNGYDESDDPDDSDDPHSRSGSGSGSRSQQESNTNADSDSDPDSDWYSDSGSQAQAQAQSQSSFSSHDRGDGECRCGVVTNAGLSVSGAKSLMDASVSGVVSSVAPSLFIALVVMYM